MDVTIERDGSRGGVHGRQWEVEFKTERDRSRGGVHRRPWEAEVKVGREIS